MFSGDKSPNCTTAIFSTRKSYKGFAKRKNVTYVLFFSRQQSPAVRNGPFRRTQRNH